MATASVTGRRRPHAGVVATCGLAAAAISVISVMYAGLLLAGRVSVTPPVFMVGDALTVFVVATCAIILSACGRTRVAIRVAVLVVALVGYGALVTAMTAWAPAPGLVVSAVVSAASLWYLVVLAAGARVTIVCVEELAGRSLRLRVWSGVILVLFSVGFVLGLAVDPLYPGVEALLSDTILATPPFQVAFTLVVIATMVSFGAPPILAWRAAVRTRRGVPNEARDRLALVAIAAACPLLALITCAALGLAQALGLVSESVASGVLSLAFSIPLIVFAAGITAAFAVPRADTAASLRVATRWVLTGLWFVVGVQLVIIVAGIFGRLAGDEALFAVAAVASVLTVCFIAAYVPVSRRVLAFTAPVDVDRLAEILSPREREVLALIAAGDSNAAIAGKLYLSERTVDSHVSTIFGKLGLDRSGDVNRRVQAAATWIQAGDAERPRIG